MVAVAAVHRATLVAPIVSPRFLQGCFLLSVALVIATLQTWLSDKPGELGVYLKAAERLQAGDIFYRTDDGPAFSYPPFFALLFVPLTWFPQPVANFVWNGVNAGLLCGCILLVRYALQPQLSEQQLQWFSAWSIITAILSIRFIVSPIEYRSHDSIVLMCMLWGLRASQQGKDISAGVWCGLATACKATPLLFLPMLLLQRRWRASAGFVAALSLATLLPDALYPAKSGGMWVMKWYQVFVSKVEASGPAAAKGAWQAWNPLNQSVSGTLYRLTTPPKNPEFEHLNATFVSASPRVRKFITLSALASVFIITLLATMRRPPAEQCSVQQSNYDIAAWSVVLCATLLLSPMSSKQHFCFLMLPIAAAVAQIFSLARTPWHHFFAVGLIGIFLLGTCLAKDIVGKFLGDYAQAYGSLTLCALLCWGLSLAGLLRDVLGAKQPAINPANI
jgi:Glycosyltransferase family 87